MSIKLMNLIWDNGPESCTETLIMLSIADNANDEGLCWPSYNTIAKKSRISRRYCIELVQKLIDEGWLNKTARYIDGKQSSNYFIINVSKLIKGDPQFTPLVNPNSLPSELDSTPLVISSSPKPSVNRNESSVEAVGEIPYSTTNSFDTLKAKSNWGNIRHQDIEELYRRITNQITIPSEYRNRVIEDLGAVLDHYGDIESAVPVGQRNFLTYINQDRKDNSGKYSPLRPGWIDKWLEVIYRGRASAIDKLAKEKSV